MNKFLLMVIVGLFSADLAARELPIIQFEKPHHANVLQEMKNEKQYVIKKEGAGYVKVHFSKFNIPKGVLVRVSNPEGTEEYFYSKSDTKRSTKLPGDGPRSFSAMSISGDTAIVEVLGYQPDKHIGSNLIIDSVIVGLTDVEAAAIYQKFEEEASLESTCGDINDRKYVECFKDDWDMEYERRRPVARITNGSGSRCTAWRVGESNHMITNNHCNSTQAAIAASEVWFNYEYYDCSGSGLKPGIVKVPGDTLLYTSRDLDITLFTIGNFELSAPFGYFGLEPRHGVLGERIYRIGHGAASPKQIALHSDVNASGFCEIDDISTRGFIPDSDYGYWCDSTGGSSGSPVLTPSNNNAIALHHFGGCMNQGVKTYNFWPHISTFFNDVVPQGDNKDKGNLPPIIEWSFECTFGTCIYEAIASDPDGTIEKLLWSFGDGTTSSEVAGVHIYDTTGVYLVSVYVQDNQGGTNYKVDHFPITLEGENIKPVSAWSVASDNGDYTAVFTEEAFDWDGTIVDWQWWVVDSGDPVIRYPVGQKELTHTYKIGGLQAAYLKVWDDFGDTMIQKKSFIVTGPIMNARPVANFSVAVNYNTVTFTDHSTDDFGIKNWYYIHATGPDFPRQYSRIQHPIETFPMAPGELSRNMYTQLQVNDIYGGHDSHNVNYTITAPPEPTPPVADFTFNVNNLTVNFTDTSTDETAIVSWNWDFGDGNSSTDKNPSNIYATIGTYSVKLDVTDTDGEIDSITKTVTLTENLTLNAVGNKQKKGMIQIALSWNIITGNKVDVYYQGKRKFSTPNDGNHIFSLKKKGEPSVRICITGTNTCSNTVVL